MIKDSNAMAVSSNISDTEDLSQSTSPLQQLFGLSLANTSTSATPNINDLSKSLFSIFSNAQSSTSPLPSVSASHSNYPPNSSSSSSGVTVHKTASNASNDDSLDSMASGCNGNDKLDNSKKTRRRKPQKTVRLPSESSQIVMDDETDPKDDPDKCSINTISNGSNFASFGSDGNSLVLPMPSSTTSITLATTTTTTDTTTQLQQQQPLPAITPPLVPQPSSSGDGNDSGSQQMHSIDLSQASNNVRNDAFMNGYTKLDEFMKTHHGGDQPANGIPPHELINGTNLFPPLNYLRNSSIPNDISLFPNTDDLVKKVEELVKCNERNNGFGDLIDAIKGPESKLSMDALYPNNLASTTDQMGRSSCGSNANGATLLSDASRDEVNGKIQGDNENQILTDADAKMTDAMNVPHTTTISEDTPSILRSNDNVNVFCDPKEENSTKNIGDSTSSDCPQPLEQNAQHNHLANNDDADEGDAAAAKHGDSLCDVSDLNETANETANTSMDIEAVSTTTQSKTPAKNTSSRKRSSANARQKGKTKAKRPLNKSATNSKASNGKNSSTVDASKTKKVSKEPVTTFRGPYVHVSNDGTTNVINTPLHEESSDKQKNSNRNFEILAASERNKLRGLHVSTLSNKYDADNRDTSWMCVFCKLGPHKYGLGDLFGPFIMTTESEEYHAAMVEARVGWSTKKTASKGAKKTLSKGLAVASTSKDADVSTIEQIIIRR